MTAPAQNPTDAILTELRSLRTDVHEMRQQSDSRHRTLANEMAELRSMALRALDAAAEAKRVADASSHDTRDMQRAVIQHTSGLSARQNEQAAKIEKLVAETGTQTTTLDALFAAETERKTRERILDEQAERRWKIITRWWPIVTALIAALIAVLSFLYGHWKP